MLFVANRLLESNDPDDNALGRSLRDEVGRSPFAPIASTTCSSLCRATAPRIVERRISTTKGLTGPLRREHYVEDHQDFIAAVYQKAKNLETPDELRGFLAIATVDGVWNRLLYRGAAWSLMREEGVLPANAPPLGATIETDLTEHGFSVLRAALAVRRAGASDLPAMGVRARCQRLRSPCTQWRPGVARSRLPSHDRRCGLPSGRLLGRRLFLFNETAEDLNAAGRNGDLHLILRDLGRLRGLRSRVGG